MKLMQETRVDQCMHPTQLAARRQTTRHVCLKKQMGHTPPVRCELDTASRDFKTRHVEGQGRCVCVYVYLCVCARVNPRGCA
eukprot:805921-Alexandrium_andersonii.AAC.1